MKHVIRGTDLVRASCLTFAAAVAGCGVRKAEATVAGNASPCSITLAGAKAGTLPCADDRTAMYGIKEKTTLVGFSSNDSVPVVMIAIKVPGAPTVKSYRSSAAGIAQGIWVRNGSSTWVAEGSKEEHAVGSFLLTLTSVQEVPLASDVKGYEVHGTLTATLQPDPDTGAKGTVTMTARF